MGTLLHCALCRLCRAVCSQSPGVSLCRLTSSQLRCRGCTAAGHRNHWRAETSECAAPTRVTELSRIAAPVRGNGPSGYYWTAALLRCGRVINYKLPQCSLNLTSTEIIKWGQHAQCFQKYLSAVAFLKKRKLCEMAKISKEMQLFITYRVTG